MYKPQSAENLMKNQCLVKHYAGSRAYGTSLPSSDTDFRGIFCADPLNVRTPFFPIREASDSAEEDTKYYELAHFMKLCLECNPNIIETLWVDINDVIITSTAYKLLREQRSELLSSKVAFTFSGYAVSQLKRIKGHNKWINNPQDEEPPRQIDFISFVQNFTRGKVFTINLEDYHNGYRLIPYGHDIYGLVEQDGYQTFSKDYTLNTVYDEEHPFVAKGGNPLTRLLSHRNHRTPLFIVKFNKDEYLLAKDKWKNYWTWKNNRNETRSELEEQFGYDTKHAMHLVRLLRMGEEILSTGEVIVKRPDAKELLDIRGGAWKYEELVEYAEEKDNIIRGELYKNTSLPKKPNITFAANLLIQAQDLIWNYQN